MSSPNCPDWKRLAATYLEPEGETLATQKASEWQEAQQHLRTCPRCQDVSVAADPTLLFLRLPEVEVTGEDLAEVQRAVRHGRRLSSLVPDRSRSAGGMGGIGAIGAIGGIGARARRTARAWFQLAATVALLVGAITLRPGDSTLDEVALGAGGMLPGLPEIVENPEPFPGERGLLPVELLEEGKGARLYQLAAPDLAVVMVFDETLPF